MLSTESCTRCTKRTSRYRVGVSIQYAATRPLQVVQPGWNTHPVGLAVSGGWRNAVYDEHKDDRLTVGEDTTTCPPCSPPPAWKSPSPPPITREGGLYVRIKAHRAAGRALLRGGRGTGSVPAAPGRLLDRIRVGLRLVQRHL